MTVFRFLSLTAVWLATSIELASARIAPADTKNLTQHRRRQNGPSSPFDHSYTSTWASLGDSFTAGIGAGMRLMGD